jgi:hypothetical protein
VKFWDLVSTYKTNKGPSRVCSFHQCGALVDSALIEVQEDWQWGENCVQSESWIHKAFGALAHKILSAYS